MGGCPSVAAQARGRNPLLLLRLYQLDQLVLVRFEPSGKSLFYVVLGLGKQVSPLSKGLKPKQNALCIQSIILVRRGVKVFIFVASGNSSTLRHANELGGHHHDPCSLRCIFMFLPFNRYALAPSLTRYRSSGVYFIAACGIRGAL
jgi:hypothetical protein